MCELLEQSEPGGLGTHRERPDRQSSTVGLRTPDVMIPAPVVVPTAGTTLHAVPLASLAQDIVTATGHKVNAPLVEAQNTQALVRVGPARDMAVPMRSLTRSTTILDHATTTIAIPAMSTAHRVPTISMFSRNLKVSGSNEGDEQGSAAGVKTGTLGMVFSA